MVISCLSLGVGAQQVHFLVALFPVLEYLSFVKPLGSKGIPFLAQNFTAQCHKAQDKI